MSYQNCRGVKTKLETLKCNLLNNDSAVVALTETWLNSSVLTSEFCNNRIVLRKDRRYHLTGQKQGGGVLLAIKDSYEALEYDIFSDDLEALCVRIRFGTDRFLYIVVVYFVPNTSVQLYNKFYETVETKLLNCDCIILGDFNLRNYVDKLSTKQICNFKSFLAFANLSQENSIRNFNGVILDLVLVSPPIQGVCVDIDDDPLLPVDRHHPPLSISFAFEKTRTECKQIANTKFNFKRANFAQLYGMIRDQDWSVFETFSDVNTAVSHFYNVFRKIFVICVPLSKQVGKVFPVWFNYEIIKLIKLKERYYGKYKKNKSAHWRGKYSEIRRVVKHKIENAHRNYMECVQHALRADPKYFWTYIKTQKKSPDIPAELQLEDRTFKGAKDVSEGFAMYFRSVFSPAENVSCGVSVNGAYFQNTPITEEEILRALRKLKGDRAIGPDGIPGYIIKGCGEFLVEPLLQIFNLSLKTATYPSEWRISKTIPIYKSGTRREIVNYRPVAILSAVSKVFELILFDRIYEAVKDKISSSQHGFLPKKSTLTNLLSFTQCIHEAIQNGTQMDVIYTDMEKAFDRVRHSVIVDSLLKANVDGELVKLVLSYLSDRSQYVEVKGAKSACYMSNSGVPQGSNLGPLLFLIAINTITQVVKNSKALIFADDYKIFLEVHDKNNGAQLQEDLDNVVKWCGQNGFSLNVDKCACMSFSLKKDLILNPYSIHGDTLRRVSVRRDLGVIFDAGLSFTDHISDRIADASRAMGFVIRSTRHFNVDVCLKLFDAFVLPKLEYSCVIWSPQYAIWSWSIERVHRRFLKFVFFKKYGYYPERGYDHQTLLEIFNRMSLEKRRNRACLLTLYKILRESIVCPDILLQLPFAIDRIDNVKTRHNKIFYLNCPRTNLYKNSPIYRMCALYNKLASDIDLVTVGVGEFKKIIDSRLNSG